MSNSTARLLRLGAALALAVLGAVGVLSPDDSTNEELVDTLVTAAGAVWAAVERSPLQRRDDA